MSRLILVPQYPAKMRYSEWWISDFEKHLSKYFDDIVILGKSKIKELELTKYNSIFSPINKSIEFENNQIKEYFKIKIYDDDILLLNDISFPGFFCNCLYHKKPKRCFSFCHATSKNYLDYFSKNRKTKFPIESNYSKMFNKVFVATNYHKEKLGWNNIEVVGLPKPPANIISLKDINKIYDIISVNRPTNQKVNKSLEDQIEKTLSLKVIRKQCLSWDEYSKFLSMSKILLISSKEDTFNYTILDAIICKCIPICPDNLCFPEMLNDNYLYKNLDDSLSIINKVINNQLNVPQLLCQDNVDNFYLNISNLMKYEKEY